MSRKWVWQRGMIALLAVWAIVIPILWVVRAMRPTAAKTVAFIKTHPLESRTPPERLRTVEGLADRLNHMSFEERQQSQLQRPLHDLYAEMSEDERTRLWDLTLKPGIHQVVDAFDKMGPDSRQRLLGQAFSELDRLQGSQTAMRQTFGDRNFDHIVHEGLKSYFTQTDAKTKLELQPVLERVQNIVQMAR